MFDSVIEDVFEAANNAITKHGKLTSDPVRACAILGREWGEAMDEALLATSDKLPEYDYMEEPLVARSRYIEIAHAAARKRLYEELAQVAATAMLMMEGLR